MIIFSLALYIRVIASSFSMAVKRERMFFIYSEKNIYLKVQVLIVCSRNV